MSTQPKTEYRHLSYNELDGYITHVIAEMERAGYIPTNIVPIAGGGMIPAAMLFYKLYKNGLPIRLLPPVVCSSYDEGHDQNLIHSEWPDGIYPEHDAQSTLFVDEICDTGTTINHLKSRMPRAMYFSVVTKNTIPDFWGIRDERKHWWVFPWESSQ